MERIRQDALRVEAWNRIGKDAGNGMVCEDCWKFRLVVTNGNGAGGETIYDCKAPDHAQCMWVDRMVEDKE